MKDERTDETQGRPEHIATLREGQTIRCLIHCSKCHEIERKGIFFKMDLYQSHKEVKQSYESSCFSIVPSNIRTRHWPCLPHFLQPGVFPAQSSCFQPPTPSYHTAVAGAAVEPAAAVVAVAVWQQRLSALVVAITVMGSC